MYATTFTTPRNLEAPIHNPSACRSLRAFAIFGSADAATHIAHRSRYYMGYSHAEADRAAFNAEFIHLIQ